MSLAQLVRNKNDIIDIYKINASKIEVIYHANSLNSTDSLIDHPYENYILCVGRRKAYKNFKSFVEAVAPLLLKEKELKILCAGGDGFDLDEINFFDSLFSTAYKPKPYCSLT